MNLLKKGIKMDILKGVISLDEIMDEWLEEVDENDSW